MLAYCAFLHRYGLVLPATGVSNRPLQVLEKDELRAIWSEVEWPFDPGALQQNAIDFHHVLTTVFSQTAIVPFRLLSIFDGQDALAALIAERQADFIDDLRRLHDFVQMECVIFPRPQPKPESISGKAYLAARAEVLNDIQGYVQNLKTGLHDLIADVRVRDMRSGSRIFALVQRGKEKQFRSAVEEAPVPEGMSRRISGPWPPAQFLSDPLKMPQGTNVTTENP